MTTMYIGGRKVLNPSELEARRQALSDTRLARLGELADARTQVAALEQGITRIEGGIVMLDEVLNMMAPPEDPEEPVEPGPTTEEAS